MPDRVRRALHRLCDSVSGANWRPTRFEDELTLSRYACCVCHVIPSTTVLLPCSHVLCEQCANGCLVQDGGSVCPVDKESFCEDECQKIKLPAKTKQNLKAHCWNEEDGCEFVGTIEAVLLHYDRECAFHALQCPRCEQRMLRKDIAAHYVAGCSGKASSAGGGEWYGQDISFTRRDLSATLDQLRARQRQMEEVVEACRTSESARSQDMNRAIRGFENSLRPEIEQIAANITSMVTRQLNAGLEEVKAVISDSSSDHLTRVQSQMNQLVEQSRQRDASQLQEMVRVLRGSGYELKEHMKIVEANLSSILTDTQRSLQSSIDCLQQNGQPSGREKTSAVASSSERDAILWRLEKRVILSRLETFSRESMSTVEILRQQIYRHDGKPWISDVYEVQECCCCHVAAKSCLFPVCMSINNADKAFQLKQRHIMHWYQWISEDAYMKVEFSFCPYGEPGIMVNVDGVKMLKNPRLKFGSISVEALRGNAVDNGVPLPGMLIGCEDCSEADISHVNTSFEISKEELVKGDFMKDGKIRLLFRLHLRSTST